MNLFRRRKASFEPSKSSASWPVISGFDTSELPVANGVLMASNTEDSNLLAPTYQRSGSEEKSTPTTPVGSKRTSTNTSPCPTSSTTSNVSDRNNSPAASRAAPPPTTAAASLVRCATYTATDSNPSEPPIAFNEDERRALKLLSASSPLITEGPGKDPTDLSHVKSSKYRQRKFLRNFNKQDRLINDFSCALVSDILLQGHLYISENYFAFHSNVFGYITKLLIPLSSVERVTKEKTAKIIPNAVGVVTFTHKYVFGSLLSRDTTFGIMTRVWKQHTPQEPTEAIAIQAPIAEDDSGSGGLNGEEEEEEVNGEDSSSGGGPADLSAAENETTCEPDGVISGTTAPHPDAAAPFRSSSATGMHQHQPLHHSHHIHHHHQHGMIGKSAAFVKGLYSKAMHRGDGDTAPHTGSQGLLASIACVPKITILLSIATILLILLFVAAGFMILRISNVQEQLLMSRAVPRNKMEIYQEVARWQKELHSSLASEVQLTVEKHLSNIAQVRASLDALYTLFPVTGEGLQSTSEPEKTSR